MNRISTSIEQSKHLLELGLSPDTADMMWTYDFVSGEVTGPPNIICDQLKPEPRDIISWSLTALLEVIPKEPIWNLQEEKSMWYEDGDDAQYWTGICDSYVDAAYKLVCWLLENEKL